MQRRMEKEEKIKTGEGWRVGNKVRQKGLREKKKKTI